MVTYTYECRIHGLQDVVKPVAKAGRKEMCPYCNQALIVWTLAHDLPTGRVDLRDRPPFEPMRRVYNQQRRAIIRPRGWNLRPGERDPTVPGLSYSTFAHELERGELTEDASPVYTPESRARREAALAAEAERPRPLAEIDRDIPERGHQELHEWARAAYSRLEEERRYA